MCIAPGSVSLGQSRKARGRVGTWRVSVVGVQSGIAAPGDIVGPGGIQSNSVPSGIVGHQAGIPD